MSIVDFRGFAGVRLQADMQGDETDPSVLLLSGPGQTRAMWAGIADMLVQAGRRVISIDLRGHGGSEWPADGRYDLDSHAEDLRAVLAQMGSRPVVVAATLGGWIACAALARDASLLAAGLVLVDMPARGDAAMLSELAARMATPRDGDAQDGAGGWDSRAFAALAADSIEARLSEAAPGLALPTLVVRGGLSWLERSEAAHAFDALLPQAEQAEVADADLQVVTDRTEAFMGLLLDFLERKQPRAAPEFREGCDARTLRDALGCFATGVTVVTAMTADGTPIGLTANSFTSVSLDPPLLLVCIANTAGSAPALRAADRFAVNVLQIGQQPTSNRFAGKGEDRFAATPWEIGECGTPVLTGSLSSFECARAELYEAGDHFILVGRVLKAIFEPRRDPLLYFRGKYRKLHFA